MDMPDHAIARPAWSDPTRATLQAAVAVMSKLSPNPSRTRPRNRTARASTGLPIAWLEAR
jgi:hypothetical protein